MELIRPLTDVSQQEWNVAGGKGANLGELTRAGFSVPPGFVLLTRAYQNFIHAHGLSEKIEQIMQQAVLQDSASCERASQTLRALFLQGSLPEEITRAIAHAYQSLGEGAVAIRSSAITEDLPEASFAGLYESYLNIQTLDDVLLAVRQCWSSLWTARALSYRAHFVIVPQTISMAVVLQHMVQSSTSGVLFTVNPVNGGHDEVVINATRGLGEALVSGQVTPDTILVEKTTGRIKQREVSTQLLLPVPPENKMRDNRGAPVPSQHLILEDEQVRQLVRLGERIEAHFGVPQDIEWAFESEQVFVVQSRPITTPMAVQSAFIRYRMPVPPGDDTWNREHDQLPQPFDVWTRTNVGENLPYPLTPLTETNFPVLFGLNNDVSAQQPQLTRRFYGRLYFNEGVMVHNFTEEMGLPASWLHKMWGSRPRGMQGERNTLRPLRLLHKLFSLAISSFKAKKKEKTPHHTPEQFYAQIEQWVNAFRHTNLTHLNDHQLWNASVPLWSKHGPYVWTTNLRFSVTAGVSYGLLAWIVRWWTGKELAQDLVTGLRGVYSAEVGPALWHIAQTAQNSGVQDILLTHDSMTALNLLQSNEKAHSVVEELEIFLARHGHRCPNELELRNPRWEEAPEQVVALITHYLRVDEQSDPRISEARQQQRRTNAEVLVGRRLDPVRRAIFRFLLKRAQRAVTVRDNSRYYVAKFILPVRKMYVALGQRWVESDRLKQSEDIFFLTYSEIETIAEDHPTRVTPEALQMSIAQRRRAYEFWFTIIAPEAINADGEPLREEETSPMHLKGTPASGGTIRGRARLVQTMQEAMSLRPGDILVTMATDPGWTPIFPLVSGIVLEIGGQLSHGAIIAREYGVPAVVNVPEAMHRIRDEQVIEVDGSTGIITLL